MPGWTLNRQTFPFFRSFPQLDVRLNNLTITGINEFEGKPLLNVETLSTSVSLSSLWKSDGITVSEIIFNNPQVSFLVNPDGKTKWNIVKPSPTTPSKDGKRPLEIDLSKIQLINAALTYRDEASKMIVGFKTGNFNLSGFLKGSDSKLNFSGKADSIYFDIMGIKLLTDLR